MRAGVLARVVLAAVAVAAGLPPAAAAAQPPTRNVLIVHGGPEEFPGNPAFDAALRTVLFSHPTLQVAAYSEYLENEEFTETAYASLRDYIHGKFQGVHLDLIVVNAAPALQFVRRYRDELFPGVPVLFAAATVPPEVVRREEADITGILREPSHAETLELALKIHPGTTRLHVVAYAPAVDGFLERVQATVAPFSKRVQVSYANEPTLPRMLDAIRQLPADSLIFYVRYSPVTQGRVIFPSEMLAPIAEAAPVPIYSSLDTNIGKGPVGGMMRSGVADANRIGELAMRILEGVPPRSIPIEAAAVRPVFDWGQLKRWGIDESRLPPGSDVRLRAPGLLELYGSYIAATAVVLIAQLVLIAGLLRQRARLRRADNTIRAREASLRVSYERSRHLAGRLIGAQEAARADIARDLHDDVSQKLAYASIGVQTLMGATGDIGASREALEDLDRQMRSTFEGVRRLSHELHPATLRLVGLAPALRSHCSEVAKRQGVEVTFSGSDNLGAVHPDVAMCFFRIAQESLRNGTVHGGAKHLGVTLTRTGDRLELAVTDDGRGFDVSALQRNGDGLGLVTMEERANLVGGDVLIVSDVGRGTTVRVTGPANPAPPTG